MSNKVAIACQGGGSHAAFAAGVLRELLQDQYAGRFDLVALSGTSGGAACAALAWSGLLRGGSKNDSEDGRRLARELLDAFWHDLMATPHNLMDMAMDFWGQLVARLFPTFEASPYNSAEFCAPALEQLLRKYVRLEEIQSLPVERQIRPMLYIGATDILRGNRVITCGCDATYADLIASAAIPTLFRAVSTRGTLFWDGLFSANPPIRQFTDMVDIREKPDEIWIIRINPQSRKRGPRSLHDILDRRNELSGNLSMSQELAYIRKINELRDQFPDMQDKYKHIEIRLIEIGQNEDLDLASKLDRSPSLIRHLMDLGRRQAPKFLDPNTPPWEPTELDQCECAAAKHLRPRPAATRAPARAPNNGPATRPRRRTRVATRG